MFWLAAVTLLNDATVTGYVERLCHRLAPEVSIAVTVDTAARAAARYGDGIRISTAMISGARNEAELAGILAHEIAHYRSDAASAPLGDDGGGLCLRFAGKEPKFATARQWEMDADQAAIAMLTRTGYDPAAMLRYFSALRHSDRELPQSFSAEDILIERLQLEATDHPMKDPVEDSPEFQAIRARLQ
jgi:predicted Zn-dependent protease